MPRMNADDFDQELLVLFDAYVHGSIDRRTFLERAARFAVGGATAAGLLAALSPRFAEAHSYPGTQHGFHNDTTPRYDEAAATLAWQRTLAFFNEHLRR